MQAVAEFLKLSPHTFKLEQAHTLAPGPNPNPGPDPSPKLEQAHNTHLARSVHVGKEGASDVSTLREHSVEVTLTLTLALALTLALILTLTPNPNPNPSPDPSPNLRQLTEPRASGGRAAGRDRGAHGAIQQQCARRAGRRRAAAARVVPGAAGGGRGGPRRDELHVDLQHDVGRDVS